MKNLNDYINESVSGVQHKDLGNRGMFYTNDGELTYYEGTYAYPVRRNKCFEISMLRVDADKQRKGTGSDLVKAMIEFAKSKLMSVIVYARPLTDTISEDDLIKFYTNLGFFQDDRTDDKHCLIYDEDLKAQLNK